MKLKKALELAERHDDDRGMVCDDMIRKYVVEDFVKWIYGMGGRIAGCKIPKQEVVEEERPKKGESRTRYRKCMLKLKV